MRCARHNIVATIKHLFSDPVNFFIITERVVLGFSNFEWAVNNIKIPSMRTSK
jgi:hypothetical protein